MRAAIADPAKMKGLSAPFEYVAAAIMMVAMIVQLFYCLDSLQSERKIAAYFSEVAAGVRCDDRAGKSDDSVRDIAAV